MHAVRGCQGCNARVQSGKSVKWCQESKARVQQGVPVKRCQECKARVQQGVSVKGCRWHILLKHDKGCKGYTSQRAPQVQRAHAAKKCKGEQG
eukprot:scaffold155528_cov21-Tisochrysis_lutea.AAC.1